MNNILQLKGQFHKRRNTQSFGPVNLPKDAKVSAKHVNELRKQLEGVKKYWESTPVIKGALVSAHYQRIVPKSNRLQFLLGEKGKHPNDAIRGAKFVDELSAGNHMRKKHVFTYFVSLDTLQKTINYLEKCEEVIKRFYNNEISDIDTENMNKGQYDDSIMKKNPFLKTVVDVFFVERFQIDRADRKSVV